MSVLSLLIVDSSSTFSKVARQFLLKSGSVSEIETSAELQEALEIVRIQKPDLILIELDLLNQVDMCFCRELKASAPGIVIIGLTLFNHGFGCSNSLEDRGIDATVSREYFADSILPIVRSLNSENLA